MKPINIDIVLLGVGGQGIGLLSEVMIRAADLAGHPVRGVDTHGLAQRGGTVLSQIRIGPRAHSALIRPGRADVVVALERNEALRGLNLHLRDGGTLVYYDCELQPLAVRLGKAGRVENEQISQECHAREIRNVRVSETELPDVRMQNVALLAALAKQEILSGVKPGHYREAIAQLLAGETLRKNLEVFDALVS